MNSPKPLISKEQFVEYMTFVKNKDKDFDDLCAKMEVLSPGMRVDFLPQLDYNSKIFDLLGLLLGEPLDDSLIEYFVYVLDWGEHDYTISSYGKSYQINSLEKLYDALVDINFTRPTRERETLEDLHREQTEGY